jgi:hypothetical protein
MDLDEVREATREALRSAGTEDVDYIDDDLLSDYERNSRDAAEAEGDEGLEPPEAPPQADPPGLPEDLPSGPRAYVYGNHPVWVRRNDRPPYVGVFYWYNGSPNRPNDPCGRMNRWHRWLHYTPYGEQYRRCAAGYVGFRFLIV